MTESVNFSVCSENELFRSSFKFASIGMALVGIDGAWLDVNEAVCRISGYTREELLTKTFQEITHPDDLEKDLQLLHKLLGNEIDHYEMEKRYLHKSGRVVWILLTVSLVRAASGEPRFFISQIQDISEQISLREEVARKKREVENILKYTASAIARFDRDKRYVYGNQMLGVILGLPLEEIIGKPLRELSPVIHYYERIEKLIDEVFQTGAPTTFESLRRIDDADVHLLTNLSPEFDEHGSIEYVLGLSTNITQIKETENELRGALAEIKQLQEILPICSYCKKIRDDRDYWLTVENYISTHTDSKFSHSICPHCYESKVVPELEEYRSKHRPKDA